MDFKKSLNQLFDKEMSRQEFLAHAGAATAAIIGVGGLIKSITDPHGKRSSSAGYGASSYGGERKLGKINRRLN